LGVAKPHTTVLKELQEATEEIRKGIGITHTKGSYEGYVTAFVNLSRFIREKYGRDDIPFSQLDYSFIEDYDLYLKTEHRLSAGSVVQHTMFLRKSVRRAINKGVIKRDPFFGYVPDKPTTMRKWLSGDELEKIMTATIDNPVICFMRDMFVFAAFTGLSYIDLKNLRKEQILTDMAAGKRFISIQRQKTGSNSIIPLLDIPEEIIKKHSDCGSGGKAFKMLSMGAVCRHMKIIAKISKLNRDLTFHMARHTFATSICLSQGVPIEKLSQMMGHRSIKTTQIYAEVTGAKIEEDMQALSLKIEDNYLLK
jgi:site-specific recombinase XerD